MSNFRKYSRKSRCRRRGLATKRSRQAQLRSDRIDIISLKNLLGSGRATLWLAADRNCYCCGRHSEESSAKDESEAEADITDRGRVEHECEAVQVLHLATNRQDIAQECKGSEEWGAALGGAAGEQELQDVKDVRSTVGGALYSHER